MVDRRFAVVLGLLAVASAAEPAGAPAGAGLPKRGEAILFAHIVLMLIAWWFLLPLGMVFANRGRSSNKGSGAADNAWFKLHSTLMPVGWVLQVRLF